MLIGAHVRSSGGLLSALARGEEIGAHAVQIFTQSPRMWRSPAHDPDALAAYRAAQAAHPAVRATFCHATYLVNLATSDAELRAKSERCLTENLLAASAIGAAGLVLHVGSHRGEGFDGCLAQVATALVRACDTVAAELGERCCPLLLENTAGAGGTVGRSFDELARILDATGGDDRLGVCLDTQHLFASGTAYATPEQADAVVTALDRAVGLERLSCLHLNDSKVPLASNRDRHENLGAGEIGEDALALLLGHPRLDGRAALLEVPGAGEGPRAEDVATARHLLARGQALWGVAPRAPARPRARRSAPAAGGGARPSR